MIISQAGIFGRRLAVLVLGLGWLVAARPGALPAAGALAAQPATTPLLLVSETLYDPADSEPGYEWIELIHLGTTTLDLSAYKVGDEETAGGGEGMYQFPAGSSAAPEQVVLIANRAADFALAYGFNPDYEVVETVAEVPNLVKYTAWASGSVSLANSGDDVLILDGADNLVDALSWGSSTFAFNPSAPDVAQGHSLERNPANADTDSAADWADQADPTPGSVPIPPPGCGKTGAYLATWEIQGSGHTSPYDGQSVGAVRGIVTADFQQGTGGPEELDGFFIQAHETDCDPTTSEGLWVYSGSNPKSLSVGDLVEITGSDVAEYQGPASFIWEYTLTEVTCFSSCNVTTLQAGVGLPPAETYQPPQSAAEALAYNEAREGMLVQVTSTATVVAPVNPFNELVMRLGVGVDRPSQEEGEHGDLITLDGDGVSAANCGQDGLGYIKTFDVITANPTAGFQVFGPLNYGFNAYKVQQADDAFCLSVTPGNDASYDPADNPPPAAAPDRLLLAGINAWNFFDTDNDPAKSDELPSAAEYDRKARKLADAVCQPTGLNQPHIIALQEVENDVVLQKLTTEIMTVCGASYAYHTLAGPDDRSIQLAFLTRTDQVSVLSIADRQGCSAIDWGVDYEAGDHPPDITCNGPTPHYLFDRPPLELIAQITLGGAPRTLTIYNNHFKSKLNDPACAEPDCTDLRVEQARFVDGLVDSGLASDPNAAIVVMGDLNDTYVSAPVDELDKTYGVLTNVWDDIAGPPSVGQGSIQRYSYIYNGVSQTLDHLLVSDALNALARVVSVRHLNADWPGAHLDDDSMFRASDHDFMLTALDFPPAGVTTLHIGDLDGSSIAIGNRWRATVTATVVDAGGAPVANATVSGDWSIGYSGPGSCVTDSAGVCSMTSGNIGGRRARTVFTVTDVAHASLVYDPLANTDPDGDSDGTTITVLRP